MADKYTTGITYKGLYKSLYILVSSLLYRIFISPGRRSTYILCFKFCRFRKSYFGFLDTLYRISASFGWCLFDISLISSELKKDIFFCFCNTIEYIYIYFSQLIFILYFAQSSYIFFIIYILVSSKQLNRLIFISYLLSFDTFSYIKAWMFRHS